MPESENKTDSGITPSKIPRGSRSVSSSTADKRRISSGQATTKNVSHVPCKFYRQSVCQAGEKCPFSHEVDNRSQAICKYYQKGNCKFGAKCALAHIGPDGKQVNKRQSKPKSPRVASATVSTAVPPPPPPASNPTVTPKIPAAAQSPILPSAKPIPMVQSGASSQPIEIRSLGFRTASMSVGESTLLGSRSSSMSHSAGSASTYTFWGPTAQQSLPSSTSLLHDDSAIADDTEDEDSDDVLGCEEDLVPSSLSDLLTPQERQRRNSRNSYGTRDLWSQHSRPSFGSNPASEISKIAPIGKPPMSEKCTAGRSSPRANQECLFGH